MSLPLSVLTSLLIFFHPIKISVCEINYNTETNKLETIIRVFYDDLEENLSAHYDKTVHISEVSQENKKLIDKYLRDNFHLSSENISISYEFLGFEMEDDVIWIYLESETVEKLNEITIKNSMLMGEIPQQKNIIHFEYNNEIKSYALNVEKPICQFSGIQSW